MGFNCLKVTVPQRGKIDIYIAVRKETGFIYVSGLKKLNLFDV